MSPTTKPLTTDQVKAKFRANGMTFTDWAREHGYSPRKVIRLLNGYEKGRYGQSHEIAVKLGLKADPEQLAA
ncbi:DNA-binding protein [Ottowia pentelensis]|uniref:DNA-binding protein n=1 Tax=Ottowia pentelensis TaxID=511108 RepID=A0ABV6PTL5_9BURK